MNRTCEVGLAARPQSVAPGWHLAATILLLLSGPLLSAAHPTPVGASPASLTTSYLALLGTELLFAFVVWLGLKLRGLPLRALLGTAPLGGRAMSRDLLSGAGVCLVVLVMELLWPGASATPLHASTAGERGLWVVVAVVVAASEELVFRGYLLRQLEALSGSAALAVVAQAALFVVPHGEQGLQACVKIFIDGLALGLVATARRSLWPGMAAHALIDLAAGLAPL